MEITFNEFRNAVTSCEDSNGYHYKEPTENQYNTFSHYLRKSSITSKREVAMFLAHVIHETGGLVFKVEYLAVNQPNDPNYDYIKKDCPYIQGKRYYGRGYMQLSWNYNYADASKALFDGDSSVLLENPELVLEEKYAWKTAFWFWNTKVHGDSDVRNGKFYASTLKINSRESKNSITAQKRYKHYKNILEVFNIHETPIH
jgi:predicted chitinase